MKKMIQKLNLKITTFSFGNFKIFMEKSIKIHITTNNYQ
ncbi:hypothetical protein PATA110615_27215 [Paenibacillus taichungensis]